MKRGIVIIPKENSNLKFFSKEFADKKTRHGMFMKEVLENAGYFFNIQSYSPWLWGKACSEAGLIILTIDSDTTVMFLPEIIDEVQFNWLNQNRKMIKNFKHLIGVNCYKDKAGNINFISYEDAEELIVFEELERDIEEKYELYKEIKKGGEKGCYKILI